MRPLRINGHRVPCQVCRRHYAVIQWHGTMAICGACNRAFFIGYMVGRNAEYDIIARHYTLTRKEASE